MYILHYYRHLQKSNEIMKNVTSLYVYLYIYIYITKIVILRILNVQYLFVSSST